MNEEILSKSISPLETYVSVTLLKSVLTKDGPHTHVHDPTETFSPIVRKKVSFNLLSVSALRNPATQVIVLT